MRLMLLLAVIPLPARFQEAEREIQALIARLADENPETRAAATAALEGRIGEALPLLRKAAVEAIDPQVRAAAGDLAARHSAGAVLWTYECGHGFGLTTPHKLAGVTDDLVLVVCGCNDSTLVALDAPTGRVAWTSREGGG